MMLELSFAFLAVLIVVAADTLYQRKYPFRVRAFFYLKRTKPCNIDLSWTYMESLYDMQARIQRRNVHLNYR